MINKERLVLAAMLTAALGLRLLALPTDLPQFSSLDEQDYIETALRFGAGTFRMSSYMHGALYQIVLCLEFAAYFILGRAVGLFPSSEAFLLSYLKDPTPFFLLARGTAALCGVGLVWLSVAIGRRLYNPRVGLMAGLFTAFSLLMFQMSFLALADVPAVFLLMLGVYLAVLSVEQPNERKLYAASAALVGLAAACKYHAGFGIAAVLAAAYLKWRERPGGLRALLSLAGLGLALAAAGFCVGLPQVFFDPAGFYRDLFQKLAGLYIGGNPIRNSWLFPLTHHLRNGLGIPLETAAVLGLGWALRLRSKGDLMMLSVPAAFYAVFMHAGGFAYHWLPTVPFLLILAARCLDAALEKLLRRRSLTASLLLAAVVGAPTFLDSVRYVDVSRSPGTRARAQAWIEEHVPAGSAILAEGYVFTAPTYVPRLAEGRACLERDLVAIKADKGTGRSVSLMLTRYDELYGGARAYDIRKVRLMNSRTLAEDGSPFLMTTGAQDEPAGWELAGMYIPAGYAEKRRAVMKEVRSRYGVLTTIAPTEPFTAFFPHLMDQDYRLIRSWPLFSRGKSRGPAITVWERKSRRG